MANQPTSPYGSLLGLPAGVQTADQLQKFRKQEEAEKFSKRMRDSTVGMSPQDSQVFTQFSQLGNMLGQKISGGPSDAQFTPDEEQGLFAMEAYNKNMDEAKSSDEWAKMDATDRSFASQQAMIDATQQSGDFETAMALGADLARKKLEWRKTNAQANKLETEAAAETAVPTGAERASNVHKFAKGAYSPTEIKQHRELIKSSDDMVKIADNIATTFEDVSQPSELVGNVGGMNRLVNSIGRGLSGGLNISKKIFTDDGDVPLSTFAETLSDDMVPESIRNDANMASRYKAAIMQMVYADARLNEPGARQLSDADIENAMVRLGVDNNDPQAVVDVFFGNMENRINGMDEQFRRIGTVLEPVGGNAALRTMYGTDVLGDIDSKRQSIQAIRGRGQEAVTRGEAETTTPAGTPAPNVPLSPAVSRYLQ